MNRTVSLCSWFLVLIPTSAHAAWINEFHYDNVGPVDVQEFVEIVLAPGESIANFSVALYDGSSGAPYLTLPGTSFTAGSTLFGFVVYASPPALTPPPDSIQDGPDALALVSGGSVVSSGGVPQFLSYGGTVTATSGPANSLISTDIGLTEAGALPGQSLYLTGLAGNNYSDFTWAGPQTASPGLINGGQDFAPAVPEPASLLLAAIAIAMLAVGRRGNP